MSAKYLLILDIYGIVTLNVLHVPCYVWSAVVHDEH